MYDHVIMHYLVDGQFIHVTMRYIYVLSDDLCMHSSTMRNVLDDPCMHSSTMRYVLNPIIINAHISSGLEFCTKLVSKGYANLICVGGRNLIVDCDLERSCTQLRDDGGVNLSKSCMKIERGTEKRDKQRDRERIV